MACLRGTQAPSEQAPRTGRPSASRGTEGQPSSLPAPAAAREDGTVLHGPDVLPPAPGRTAQAPPPRRAPDPPGPEPRGRRAEGQLPSPPWASGSTLRLSPKQRPVGLSRSLVRATSCGSISLLVLKVRPRVHPEHDSERPERDPLCPLLLGPVTEFQGCRAVCQRPREEKGLESAGVGAGRGALTSRLLTSTSRTQGCVPPGTQVTGDAGDSANASLNAAAGDTVRAVHGLSGFAPGLVPPRDLLAGTVPARRRVVCAVILEWP